MRVLIVGAGIAGPTLAYWLHRTGHVPTLVERSPRLLDGGYIVDFWGAGFDVAERMGIVPRLMDEGYHVKEVREVSSDGRRIAHFDPRNLLGISGGRFVSIHRSDLARTIYDSTDGDVEVVFGDTVKTLDDDGDRVRVEFMNGQPREFDIVVGADGLHSQVRKVVFEKGKEHERELGIAFAVFDVEGYRPRDELVAVTHTVVAAQALRFSLRDDRTLFCFTFRHDGAVPEDNVAAQHELVRNRLHGLGWEVPAILEQLPRARTFFMDRASQIRLPTWSRGRVALVGDAAACPSLLAGQGSALAMIEAYVLACAIHEANGDHRAAFASYERQLAKLVRDKQDAAIGMGAAFAPRNRAQLWLRNSAVRLMAFPPIASLAMGRGLRDPIRLPPAPTG